MHGFQERPFLSLSLLGGFPVRDDDQIVDSFRRANSAGAIFTRDVPMVLTPIFVFIVISL